MTSDRSATLEIEVANLIFKNEGSEHIGAQSIARLLDIIEDKNDLWLVY